MSRIDIADRSLLVELYFKSDESVNLTFKKYRKIKGIKNSINPCKRSTLINLVKKFRESGSLKDLSRCQAADRQRIAAISNFVRENRRTSVRKLSSCLKIPRSSVHRTLVNDLHLHSYKPRIVQLLSKEARQIRKQFCQDFLETIDKNQLFLPNVLWSDEASFYLRDAVSVNNVYYWCTNNPNTKFELPLASPKVTVWCGFNNRFLLKPYFFDGNVTSNAYCDLILNHVIPQLKLKRCFSKTIYQQDGAPAHTSNQTLALLHKKFPGRLISKKCGMIWPPYSPDIAPPDYFLWGYLKSKVYENRSFNDLNDLKQAITYEVTKIPPVILQKVCDSLTKKLKLCLKDDGAHV